MRRGAAPSKVGAAVTSDLRPFGQGQSILNIHAEISDRALDLGMAKQDLDSSKIAGLLVDQRGLGSPQ